ncbi:MAG: outer membrane protein assembly factor BamE [Alphaproteobacteria bacterium]|nr:outer membrane protein assembly factor BamE [Alphaproteobacteria bacterium]
MSISKIFATAFWVCLVSACSAAKQNEWFVSHTGNMPSPRRIARVEVGTSKDDVINTLGMPSSVNVLDNNSWVYTSSDIEKMAFFAPKEINRDVLRITFNQADEVSSIEHLSLADGVDVTPNADKTDVRGQRPGFFKKYFGGVGQYMPFGGKSGNRL